MPWTITSVPSDSLTAATGAAYVVNFVYRAQQLRRPHGSDRDRRSERARPRGAVAQQERARQRPGDRGEDDRRVAAGVGGKGVRVARVEHRRSRRRQGGGRPEGSGRVAGRVLSESPRCRRSTAEESRRLAPDHDDPAGRVDGGGHPSGERDPGAQRGGGAPRRLPTSGPRPGGSCRRPRRPSRRRPPRRPTRWRRARRRSRRRGRGWPPARTRPRGTGPRAPCRDPRSPGPCRPSRSGRCRSGRARSARTPRSRPARTPALHPSAKDQATTASPASSTATTGGPSRLGSGRELATDALRRSERAAARATGRGDNAAVRSDGGQHGGPRGASRDDRIASLNLRPARAARRNSGEHPDRADEGRRRGAAGDREDGEEREHGSAKHLASVRVVDRPCRRSE